MILVATYPLRSGFHYSSTLPLTPLVSACNELCQGVRGEYEGTLRLGPVGTAC